MIFRGTQLDLVVYSRVELKGSDHRPSSWRFFSTLQFFNAIVVFAVFCAAIRIIDQVKRAALYEELLRSISSTAPNEKYEVQDNKLPRLPSRSDGMHIDCG